MEKRGILPIVLLSTALLGCSTIGKHFKNAFVNNYDGAGHFTTLVQAEKSTLLYIDSLDSQKGFDAVCILHLKIFDETQRGNLWKEVKIPPEVHYGLPDAYINSNEEAKKDIRWRGDLARYYKNLVPGQWKDRRYGKFYDAISVVGVTSEIGTVVLQNAYIRFWGDRWMEIPIDAEFKINPGNIYYLGTLMIVLRENPHGKLTGLSSLKILGGDRYSDMNYFEQHFPRLFDRMQNTFVVLEWT